ncbi:hypothetical protein ACFQVC_22840 [Streptomyces monticola]|uniref:Uncharacterized protein n=1 Tax=Streptomyces monticola TaxID=2666263 RepID=A0ABW2JMW5_9ACTN
MNPLHPPALSGERVHRIHWLLGTDRLLAVCHCGAEREFEDPVPLWDWLLGHPDDHRADATDTPGGDPAALRPRPGPEPGRSAAPEHRPSLPRPTASRRTALEPTTSLQGAP